MIMLYSLGSVNRSPALAPLGWVMPVLLPCCFKGYFQEKWLQFATFKKDTLLGAAGGIYAALCGAIPSPRGARAGERLNEPNDRPR